MATNKVQIQVELKGSEQVNKQLGKIEESAVDLKEGFNGVGESFKSVGDIVRSQGSPMADAFGTLGDSVGAITESVGAFKDGLAVMGETGGKAWVAMLGPLAAVVSGITLAYEAYRQFSGAAQEAEDAAENMAAAAGDTASRLEAMVEAGINLGTEALREYVSINERARLSIEETIKANEKRTLSDQKLKDAIKNLESAETSLLFTDIRVAKAKYDLEQATNQYNIALDKQVQSSIKANEQNKIAFELQELLMKSIVDYQKEEEDQVVRYNDLIERSLSLSNAKNKEQVANKATAQTLTKLYEEQIQLNKVLKVQEDQLKKGIVTQDQYDQSQKAIKQRLKDNTEEMKKQNDQLEMQIKLNEAVSKGANAFVSVGKAINTSALSIEDLNRQISLLDRNLQDQKDTLTDYGFAFNETVKTNIKSIGHEMDTVLRTSSLIKYQQEELKKLEEQRDKAGNISLRNSLQKKLEEQTYFMNNLKLANDFQYNEANKAIAKLSEETSAKLIDIEDKRTEVLLDIRIKEINEMEVSEKRKKKLREDALQDALYTSKRLTEITKNSLKDRINAATAATVEENNQLRIKQLNEINTSNELAKQRDSLRIENFKSEMSWRKDLVLLTAESNKELFEKEESFNDALQAIKNQQFDKELYNLKNYLNAKEELLKTNNERYTLEQKEQLDKDIRLLQNQIANKETEQKNESQRYMAQKYANRTKERDLNLELYVQQQRFERDITSLLLDNDQIRANSTIEFYKGQREIEKNEYAKELKNYDDFIAAKKSKIEQAEEEIGKLYARFSNLDPRNNMRTADLLTKQIEEKNLEIQLEEKLIESKEKLKRESLERQSNSTREYNDRMYQYDLDHYQQVGGLIKDFSASSSQAMIDAGVAAAFAGESVSDAIRTTLRGLAQEATARALFESAAALGSWAIGDARGAALHGKSALAFGIAAAGMGALTAAVGVPGGSSGGGGGATSPSGMSQTSQAPQREEARQEAMVFNINFGNAVIYDTRAAAERAMAERVMSLGMQARRGYVPPRPRI